MLGMPKAQQADICCYVLLAMAGIKKDTLWKDAGNKWIRIHDIIQFEIFGEIPQGDAHRVQVSYSGLF